MVMNLNGAWKLAFDGGEVSCPLPGDIHSALIARNLIPDPYFGPLEQLTTIYYFSPSHCHVHTEHPSWKGHQ